MATNAGRILGASWFGGVLAASGCTAGSPSPRVAEVTASAPASAAAAAPAPPTRATTPGRIVCGDRSCDLDTEVCCAAFDGASRRCEAKGDTDASPCKDDELTKYCDESADCKSGALCCKTYDCSGGCPPKLACEQTQCLVEIAEACLPGGKCSTGFRCRIDPGQAQGTCVLERPGTDCGGKRCTGKTPVCRWEHASRRGTCVAESGGDLNAPDDNVAWLGCSSPGDCAGYACGKMADMPVQSFFCATPGFAGDRFFPILCASVGDCPKHWGAKARDCAAPQDDQAPSFVKVCVYPEE